MTIPNTARKAGPLLGTGSQTAWPFTFKVFTQSDVAVSVTNALGVVTVLALGTDYTVTLNSNQDTSPGGTVNYPISGAALPVGSALAIIGDLDYDQALDLPSGGNFSPLALENQLDRATMQIQQLKELSDRSARMSVFSSPEDVEALTSGIVVLAEIDTEIAAVAANEANVNIVADNISDVNAVGENITNVAAAGANTANINAAVANASNINAAVANAANINAAVANATNINAAVANAANINAVVANEPAIDTVAANIADVNTVAGNVSLMNTVADNLSLWRDVTAGDDIQVTNFNGTGSQVAFTLPFSPGAENNTQVFIGGVYQQKDQYTVSGTTLTFSSAPPSGTANIEVVWSRPFVLGATSSALVSFAQPGTGAGERTVQSKLRELVSVKDFGAVGDGVTDDTLAVQAAIDYAVSVGKDLVANSGVYMIAASHGVNELPGARPGRGLYIDGPLRMFCEAGTEFKLISSSFVDPTLLLIRSTQNVLIDGGFWTGERYTHIGTTGEGGNLINISCCTNVTIKNAELKYAWGDGLGAYSYPAKTVTESGTGYTSAPTVAITGGGGSGAAATAVLGNGIYGTVGTVYGCAMTNYGSGYTSEPTVTLTGGGGTGATAKAILSKTGIISGISIVNSQINKNIVFENCKVINCGRNNLTIGAADGVTIDGCLLQAADRISPKFGIDIEPDGNQEAARNILIRNCLIKDNVSGGIALGGNSGSYKINISNCVIENNGVGVSLDSTYDINIEGNRFYGGALTGVGGGGGFTNVKNCTFRGNTVNLGDTATVGKTGITATGVKTENVIFDSNVIYGCNRGIGLNGGTRFIVSNNTIRGLGGVAIRQDGTVTASQFIGNNISTNTAGDATYFGAATNCLFANNRFSDTYSNALYGIFVDCEIVGNQFTNWASGAANAAALLAAGLNGCLVQGNYFKAGAGSNFAVEESNAPTTPSYIQGNYAAYTSSMNPFQKVKSATLMEDNHLARYAAAPVAGTWLVGQRVYVPTPAAGGVLGYVCVTAGTPGTWKSFGAIAA